MVKFFKVNEEGVCSSKTGKILSIFMKYNDKNLHEKVDWRLDFLNPIRPPHVPDMNCQTKYNFKANAGFILYFKQYWCNFETFHHREFQIWADSMREMWFYGKHHIDSDPSGRSDKKYQVKTKDENFHFRYSMMKV